MVTLNGKNGKRAKSGYNQKNYIKKQVNMAVHKNIENKLSLTSMTSSFGSVSNTWSERNLTDIGSGVDTGYRVGRKIIVRSLEINGVLCQGSLNTITDDLYNCFRIVLALWDRSGGSTPCQTAGPIALSDVIRKETVGGGLIKKYYDKYHALNASSQASTGYIPVIKRFKYYKNWKKGLVIEYNGVAGTSANRNLVLSMKSDSLAAVNPGFITGYACLTYEDA